MEYIHKTLTVPCDKCKMVSFTSSIMKNFFAPAPLSRFPIKLICCIPLDQHQGFVVYLNLLLSFYSNY